MIAHSQFLQRSLQLAQMGAPTAFPNPLVGAVILNNGEVIGEGYHEKFGAEHAEINALNNVPDKSKLQGATIYVSLEPCSHHGKTPPCSLALIESGIKKVVVGIEDPNPLVKGKGIAMLREAGIEVELVKDNRHFRKINRFFFVNQQHQRPFILLKWAVTADGFIAEIEEEGKPKPLHISGDEANKYVHLLRSFYQGIMVGKNTILTDDPALTTRLVEGKNPTRIIFDRNLEIENTAKVYAPNADLIVINEVKEGENGPIKYLKSDTQDFPALIKRLYKEFGLGSILVEGGANLSNQFIASGLVDRVIKIESLMKIGTGVSEPKWDKPLSMERKLGEDKIWIWDSPE